jgi:pimeloyl-ACP methyl ester carboxylesterase
MRAAAAALAALAALAATGCVLARPERSVVASPRSLAVETVSIPSASGSLLRAWFMRGTPGRGAVLLLHGMGANRGTMLGRIRFLHDDGYTVLAPDFQAQGESGGAHVTFGQLESADAHSAEAFLRQEAPGERVGVIGVSMGGAAALVGHAPLDADALVLESVYPTIRAALSDRLAVWLGPLGFLAPAVAPVLLDLVGPEVGVTADSLRPIDRIGFERAPILMLAGTEDLYTPLSEAHALFARAAAPKQFWAVNGAGHEDLYAYAPAAYERLVGGFLAAHLRAPATTTVADDAASVQCGVVTRRTGTAEVDSLGEGGAASGPTLRPLSPRACE